MTKLFIENANKGAGAQIRIYPLDENSQVIAPDSFTSMDDLGLSFGIALQPLGEVPPSMQYTKISTGEIVQLRLGDSITHPNQIDPDIDFDADWTDEQLAEYNARMADRKDIIIFDTVKTIGDPTGDYVMFDPAYSNMGTIHINAENIILDFQIFT